MCGVAGLSMPDASTAFFSALQQLFVQVMTRLHAAARIDRVTSRNENVLPEPGCACRWVLSRQRVRQIDARLAGPQIILEDEFPPLQVLAQVSAYSLGQHRHPVFGALAVTDEDFTLSKIDVLHPQANHTSHQAHSGAVQQTRKEAVDPVHPLQHALNFAASEDNRQALWAFGSHQRVKPGQLDTEHLTVKEEQRRESLILRSRRHMTFDRKMTQKRLDLRRSHRARVAFPMEQHEPLDPLHIL